MQRDVFDHRKYFRAVVEAGFIPSAGVLTGLQMVMGGINGGIQVESKIVRIQGEEGIFDREMDNTKHEEEAVVEEKEEKEEGERQI